MSEHPASIEAKLHIIEEFKDTWSEIAGTYALRSMVYDFSDGILTIAVTDYVIMQPMRFYEKEFREKFNRHLGRVAIEKIVFLVYAQLEKSQEYVEKLRKMPYTKYLLSTYWKARAKRKREYASNRCQVCNSPENLHVHHRTYERRGEEHDEDLTVLCAQCHELFHTHSRLYVESDVD